MPGISPISSYSIPRDLRPNVAQWDIDPERAVLLIHDMQHYFLRPYTATDNPASTLVSNATQLRNICSEAGMQIAYTAQPGDMSQQQRGLLKDIWGPGMTTSEKDREIIPSLKPTSKDWLLTKWRYSAFVKTNLLERMTMAGRDQLIICGVYAHVGILSTALEAFSHDIQPFLVSDAIADFSVQDHAMALDYAARNCAMVLNSNQVLEQLEVTA